jgi:hypothetical protein
MTSLDVISPELALVDPELRALALAEFELPVRFAPTPRPALPLPIALAPAPLPATVDPSRPSLLVAAAAYLGFAIVKVAAEGVALAAFLVALISLVSVV